MTNGGGKEGQPNGQGFPQPGTDIVVETKRTFIFDERTTVLVVQRTWKVVPANRQLGPGTKPKPEEIFAGITDVDKAVGEERRRARAAEKRLREKMVEISKGTPGVDGRDGAPGSQGPKGDTGEKGDVGNTGAQGLPGKDGAVGATGSQGPQGEKGGKGDPGVDGSQGTAGIDGKSGDDGKDGKNAYQLAVDAGFKGDEAAWIASLKGEPGQDGVIDSTAVDAIVRKVAEDAEAVEKARKEIQDLIDAKKEDREGVNKMRERAITIREFVERKRVEIAGIALAGALVGGIVGAYFYPRPEENNAGVTNTPTTGAAVGPKIEPTVVTTKAETNAALSNASMTIYGLDSTGNGQDVTINPENGNYMIVDLWFPWKSLENTEYNLVIRDGTSFVATGAAGASWTFEKGYDASKVLSQDNQHISDRTRNGITVVKVTPVELQALFPENIKTVPTEGK